MYQIDETTLRTVIEKSVADFFTTKKLVQELVRSIFTCLTGDIMVDKLVCPQCKTKVELSDNQKSLVCNKCRLKYKIVDNVPVLLVDEAEKL